MSSELGRDVGQEDVQSAINDMAGTKDLAAPRDWRGSIVDNRWLERVDGAKLLTTVFEQLSEHELEFRKVRHGPLLLADIKEREPDSLTTLKAFVLRAVRVARKNFPSA